MSFVDFYNIPLVISGPHVLTPLKSLRCIWARLIFPKLWILSCYSPAGNPSVALKWNSNSLVWPPKAPSALHCLSLKLWIILPQLSPQLCWVSFCSLKQQGYLIYSRSFGDADSYPSVVLPFASDFTILCISIWMTPLHFRCLSLRFRIWNSFKWFWSLNWGITI